MLACCGHQNCSLMSSNVVQPSREGQRCVEPLQTSASKAQKKPRKDQTSFFPMHARHTFKQCSPVFLCIFCSFFSFSLLHSLNACMQVDYLASCLTWKVKSSEQNWRAEIIGRQTSIKEQQYYDAA